MTTVAACAQAGPFAPHDENSMKTNPLKDGVISENSAGVGTVTPEMVRARAAELAIMDGYLSSAATSHHFAQAKRELTGVPDMDPKQAILESAPESERWDPVPGSTGHKVPVAPSEDEDEEGRSDEERLVAGGMAEAEIDQSLQATRAAARRDL
jgi:hypothetical protein